MGGNMKTPHTLTNKQLCKAWAMYVKKPIPKLRRSLLVRYIAWYKQAYEDKINLKHFFRQLTQTQENINKYKQNRPEEKTFSEGTCFIRSYNGSQYKVEAIPNGYLYSGQTYKSLSAVARKITGKQWNGKVFFGVKNAK